MGASRHRSGRRAAAAGCAELRPRPPSLPTQSGKIAARALRVAPAAQAATDQ